MAERDGTIVIDTQIDTDGIQAGSKEAEARIRNLAKKVNDIGATAKAALNKHDIHGILNFTKIHEQYTSEKSNYVIGDILLSELIAKRDRLCGDDVFVANIPIFFLNRD